ncbi:hypothetical protein GGX14DRAFT_456674 [Mycena pura]|uniref:Uncharacterized protein n=1 Tax=Mycena pura TaxID=153505 RepID=A0AAD6VE91_9AGAR|nr:hypothetical protein GGX14DRAFT_456674 [Mycena pura]
MAMSVSAFSAKDIQPPTQSPPPPPRPSLRDVLLKAPVQTHAYTHPRRAPEALSASTVPAIYPTTSAGGWTVVHHGTLGPPGALEPFLVPAARRSQSQSSARLPIRSTGPWRPPAPSSSVAVGKDPRPLPVPPPLDTVSVGSTTFVRRFRAQSSDREQGKRRVSIGEPVPSVVLAAGAGALSPASAMASALSPISPSAPASASASAPTSTSAPASALSPASASFSRPLPLPPGPSSASAGPSSASAGPSSAHTHAGPSSSAYAPSSTYAASSHAAAVAGPGPSSSANANAAASSSSSSTSHQKAKSPAPHGQGHGYTPTSPSPSAKKSKSKPRARTPDAGLRVTNPNPERSQYSYTPPSTAAGTARSPTLPFDTVSSVWAPRPAADSHPRSAERTRTTSGGGTIGALGDRPPLQRKSSGGAIDFAKRPPLSNVGESLKRKTSGGLTASASLGTIGTGGGGTTRSPSLRRQMSGGILVPSGPRKSSLSANASPLTSPLPSPGIPPTRTAASSPAHSRSPSGSIPIFTPGASANAYAVPPAAALIPGPPPPLVTVRSRGHWRSVSVSDAADSLPMSPPVRKGSDSAVVAGSEAPKPATGVIPIATRPFVPPPPPPPLVTVRDPRATRTGSGDSIGNRASPAPSSGSNMTASPGPNTTSATASVNLSPAVSRSNLGARSSMPTPASVLPVPPPPPPPPLTMPAVLLARKDGGGSTTSSPSSYANNASGGNSALPSAGGFASDASTPSSARSTPSAFTWRSADMSEESPMTAVTTPASREGTWDKKEYAGSPLATSALPLSPQAQASKRERRRRLQLHSPIDVTQLSPTESGPQTPPIHSHPIGDESEEGGLAWPDSSTSGNGSMGEGWLAALEGEVREMEMDDTILSPPVFAAPDPADLEPDELDMYDNSFDDDLGYSFDVAVRARSRSPSPIRYARRASVDTDIIFSDSSDDDDSELDRPTTDAASADSPAASAFNDTRSTFSRARSTRSRQRRRNTRVAAPPVPLGSAAGMNRRGRARSADSSIVGFGDALAPSEMWRIEQAARGAVAAAAGHPVEMRYVYQASAAQLPASVPPPAPVLMPGRGSGAADSLSSLPSATSASYYDSASVSGHGHGSSESGGRFYGPSPSTSKSSLPLPAPPRKEGMKLIRKKDKEKAKAKEREKTMRNSMPHRNSFSLLRGSHAKTANSSAEALMVRGNAHGLERASSSSAGSEEHGASRSQHLSNSNKPTLFRANPSLGR